MQTLAVDRAGIQPGRAKKILVVDDDYGFRDMISYSLERTGYEVVIASDGLEALEMLSTEHPDLVILDIMMPGLNGYDVLKELRSDPTITAQVIIVSAAPDIDIARLSVSAYLAKPFSSCQLLWLVERVLGSTPRKGEDVAGLLAA